MIGRIGLVVLLAAGCASAQVTAQVIGSGPVPDRGPLAGDVVLLVDVSESMSLPGRWARVEALAREARERAVQGARFRLLAFHSETRHAWKGWLPLRKLTPARLARELRELKPSPVGPFKQVKHSEVAPLFSTPWDGLHRALKLAPDHLVVLSDFKEAYGLGSPDVVMAGGGIQALKRAAKAGREVELHLVQDDAFDVLTWKRGSPAEGTLRSVIQVAGGGTLFAWPPSLDKHARRYLELSQQQPPLTLERLNGDALPSDRAPRGRFRVRIADPWLTSGLPHSLEEHSRPSLSLSVIGDPAHAAIAPELKRRDDALVAELTLLRGATSERVRGKHDRLRVASSAQLKLVYAPIVGKPVELTLSVEGS